jgi:hypothetical protein
MRLRESDLVDILSAANFVSALVFVIASSCAVSLMRPAQQATTPVGWASGEPGISLVVYRCGGLPSMTLSVSALRLGFIHDLGHKNGWRIALNVRKKC